MADDLPPEILDAARKMGFGVPLAAWFRGELRDYARDVLLGAGARGSAGSSTRPRWRACSTSTRAAAATAPAQIWALLCLEEWARRWLDR